MTNEQLAILLDKYQKVLMLAIIEVEPGLPESMRVYSKDFIGGAVAEYPILDKFYLLGATIKNDIALLAGKKT